MNPLASHLAGDEIGSDTLVRATTAAAVQGDLIERWDELELPISIPLCISGMLLR
jgi:hypothetical protein